MCAYLLTPVGNRITNESAATRVRYTIAMLLSLKKKNASSSASNTIRLLVRVARFSFRQTRPVLRRASYSLRYYFLPRNRYNIIMRVFIYARVRSPKIRYFHTPPLLLFHYVILLCTREYNAFPRNRDTNRVGSATDVVLRVFLPLRRVCGGGEGIYLYNIYIRIHLLDSCLGFYA